MTGIGHNSGGVSADRLRSFVERVERIDDEIAERNADKSEIYQEAKGEGWDVKAIKAVVAERRKLGKDKAGYQEHKAIVAIYRDALGMELDSETEVRHARTRTHEPQDLTYSEVKALLANGVLPNQDFAFHGASVYFAHDEERGLVKIGVSNRVGIRLEELERASGSALKLLGTIRGNRATEIQQHVRFSKWRVRGEWFEASPEVLEDISSIVGAAA